MKQKSNNQSKNKKLAIIIILILVAVAIILAFNPQFYKDKKAGLKTHFLSEQEWNKATVIKDFTFNAIRPSEEDIKSEVKAKLYITNDKDNIYIMLKVFNDKFYWLSNEKMEYADNRLWIVFDEKNDNKFISKDEDMLSIFLSDLADPIKAEIPYAKLRASNPYLIGFSEDWSYDGNSESKWNYSEDYDWEEKNWVEKDMGKKYMKEVYWSYSGELKDGTPQDFLFEFKIPIQSTDPSDLQTKPGESVGIGLMYGNPYEGYANYPGDCLPSYLLLLDAETPECFLDYTLKKLS